MMPKPHIFDRLVFELQLGFDGRERVTLIQNRVSRFAAGGLYTVLTKCLPAVAGDQTPWVVEKLELDLGEVSLQNLEEDLAAGIARCLREWAWRVAPLPLDPAQQWPRESGERSGSDLFLFPSTLEKPALLLPESLPAISGGLNAAVASALRGPGDWSQLMAAVRDNHALRGRLASEVSSELLRGLMQSMVPEYGAWIADFSAVLLSLHDRGPLASADHNAFRRAVWECILSEVARHQPSSFTLRAFVANVLQLLAARYSLQNSALAAEIACRLPQAPQSTSTVVSLASLLPKPDTATAGFADAGKLRVEANHKPFTASPLERPGRHPARQFDDLAGLLEWGALPGTALRRPGRDAESEMLELMATSPDELAALVRRMAKTASVRKRIAQFSETAVHRVLGLLDPVNAPWMIVCAMQLRRVHAQKPLVQFGNRAFAQTLWEALLEYLAEHYGQAFDAQSVLRYSLHRLAASQKTNYELLLADLAFRRSVQPDRGRTAAGIGLQSVVDSTILALLDEDLVGIRSRVPDTPDAGEARTSLTPAGQIERWLRYGVRGSPVSLPENTALAHWLETQDDAWLRALRRCGAQEQVVHRIVNHLPFSFVVRIASLLAGPTTDLACGYLRSLHAIGRHFTGRIASSWEEQVKRYALAYLLRTDHGTNSGSSFSAEEFAYHTLQALSLRCQISYERLLRSVQAESRGQAALQDLCRDLHEGLDRVSREHDDAPVEAGESQSAAATRREFGGITSPALHEHAEIFLGKSVGNSVGNSNEVSLSNNDLRQGRLDALAHFLRTGNLPWWADALVRQTSSGWFSTLLAGQPGPLLQTLRSVAINPQAVERLLRYVPQKELEGVIRQASPEYGGLVLLYIRAGAGLAENTGLTPSQRTRAAGLHWREALQFLLDENTPKASPAEFLRITCRRVSQQLSLTTGHYASCLIQVVRRRSATESGYRALEEMLLPMQETTASATSGERHGLARESFAGESLAPESFTPEGFGPDTPMVGHRSGAQSGAYADDHRYGYPSFDYPWSPDGADRVGQLEYFLRYGELPPTVVGKSLQQFMDDMPEEALSRPGEYRRRLQKSACGEMERKRMAELFSPRLLSQIWTLLLPADHAQAVLCLELLQAATTSSTSGSQSVADQSQRLRKTCIEELLHAASRSQGRRWDAAAYLRSAVQLLVEQHSLRATVVVERIREHLALQPKEIQAKLEPVLDRVERETAVMPIRPTPCADRPDPKSQPAHQPSEPDTPLPAGEPFYIGNAGAILLWPFLGRFFQTLGLLPEKGDFRTELERSRAIHLVQYLATGKMDVPEHELLLNKILCGAVLETPLEPVSPLTEPEEKLSIQLLHGLIGNWEKLHNTSIEGLRQSFLVREGRLLRKPGDDSWSLVVSTKGYDVLLDSLPWRLSLIRLPWMKTVLHVKWR